VLWCDRGEHSSSYSMHSLLRDDDSCHSSKGAHTCINVLIGRSGIARHSEGQLVKQAFTRHFWFKQSHFVLLFILIFRVSNY
jgi:hypothetical protein